MEKLEKLITMNELKAVQIMNLKTMNWLREKNNEIDKELRQLEE